MRSACLPPLLLAPLLSAQNTEQASLARTLLAAGQTNTLLSSDLPPWHLKAAYRAFDADGKAAEQGTFEEFYAGPKKDRITYASSGFTQTDYILQSGHLRTGAPRWAGIAEQLVRHNLVHPMPYPSALEGAVFSRGIMESGGTFLACISITAPAPEPDMPALSPAHPAYCFTQEENTPVLRFVSSAGHAYETTYTAPISFEGHTVARNVVVLHAGKPFLNIDVQVLEPLRDVGEAVFTPPPEARKPPPQRIRVAAPVAQSYLLHGVPPSYPLLAEHAKIEGLVVLRVLIDAEGRVVQTETVTTPSKDLAIAAIDAVRQWSYKPYLLNGEPVEVLTEIRIMFHLPKK